MTQLSALLLLLIHRVLPWGCTCLLPLSLTFLLLTYCGNPCGIVPRTYARADGGSPRCSWPRRQAHLTTYWCSYDCGWGPNTLDLAFVSCGHPMDCPGPFATPLEHGTPSLMTRISWSNRKL